MLKTTVRVVLDTNVLIDAFSDDFSAQARLVDAVLNDELTAVSTVAVEREYRNILQRLITDEVFKDKIVAFFERTEKVLPEFVETEIDDPEDYKLLQAAVGGQADLLVTNDQHLLVVGEISGVRVVRPPEAWVLFEEQSNSGGAWQQFVRGIGIGVLVCGLLLSGQQVHAQTSAETIAEKQQEIESLNQKIEKLKNERATTAAQASEISKQVAQLTNNLQQAQLELQKTQASIQVTTKQATEVEGSIEELQTELAAKRQQLKVLIRELYRAEETPLITIWFRDASLSDVLQEQQAYETLQNQAYATITAMRVAEQKLTSQKTTLLDHQQALESMQRVLALQKNELSERQAAQKDALNQKKKEQASLDGALAEAQRARDEIQQNLFTLKDAGVKLSLTQASDMAKYASKLTGVRAALILAVLKVESDTGNNIGSGHYPDNMPSSYQREAFLQITASLGLNPNTTAISRGGAVGPGQFMPATWLGLSPQIQKLIGHTPNPFDLADAFVGTAVYLGSHGAFDPNQENQALNFYAGFGAQSNTWYSDRVQAVAKEYAKEGF